MGEEGEPSTNNGKLMERGKYFFGLRVRWETGVLRFSLWIELL